MLAKVKSAHEKAQKHFNSAEKMLLDALESPDYDPHSQSIKVNELKHAAAERNFTQLSKELSQLSRLDAETVGYIKTTLSNSLWKEVQHLKSVRPIMQHFCQKFEKDIGFSNVTALHRLVYTTKRKPGQTIREFIDELDSIAERAAMATPAGAKLVHGFPESFYTSLIIEGIGSEYEMLQQVILGQDDLTWEKAKRILLNSSDNWTKDSKTQKQNFAPSAFNTATTSKQEIPICAYCKRKGHLERQCFIKKRECGASGDAKTENKGGRGQNRHQQKKNQGAGNQVNANSAGSLIATVVEIVENEALKVYQRSGDEDKDVEAISDPYLWVFDTGATHHMTSNKAYFTSYQKTSIPVRLASKQSFDTCVGRGAVKLKVFDKKSSQYQILEMSDVLHVPTLGKSLLSITTATEKGYHGDFDAKQLRLLKKGNFSLIAKRIGRLYGVSMSPLDGQVNSDEEKWSQNVSKGKSSPFSATASTNAMNLAIWHDRMGHLGVDNVRKLQNVATGIEISDPGAVLECETCILSTMKRKPFTSTRRRATKPLELIHSDVCGPMPCATRLGERYFVTFIDDHTHETVLYLLQKKSDVLQCFQAYEALANNRFNKKIQTLHTDNGGEYCSNAFKTFCAEKGIEHTKTPPYTPELNGVSERMNQTLWNRVQCVLKQSQLPSEMWGEIIRSVTYLTNRSPSVAIKADSTPHELWFGSKPSLRHIRKLGSLAYVHVPKEKRRKLDDRGEKGILVGYASGNLYQIWIPDQDKIVVSRDVKILEHTRGVDACNLDVSNAISDQDQAWETPFENENAPINSTTNWNSELRKMPMKTTFHFLKRLPLMRNQFLHQNQYFQWLALKLGDVLPLKFTLHPLLGA